MNHFFNLINKITVVTTKDHLVAIIRSMQSGKKPVVISFLNAHAMNLAQKNESFYHNLMDSDFLLRDGIGISIAMKAFNLSPGLNMCGTDLIPELLNELAGSNVAVYGTVEPWLSTAITKLKTNHKVIDFTDGFQDDEEYLRRIAAYNPDVILLGMGMPKQERISLQIRNHTKTISIIINGGAILDYMAGRFPRAPLWMRRHGLEWLYRLYQEPVRLFRRYVIGNFIFLWNLLRCKYKIHTMHNKSK